MVTFAIPKNTKTRSEIINGLDQTPCMLVDTRKLKNVFEHFSSFGQIFYPVKANHSKDIIKLIERYGGYFEVDSIEHLHWLRELDISPEKVQYNIPIKKIANIEEALDQGVKMFTVDTVREYLNIKQEAAGRVSLTNISFFIRLLNSELLQIDDIELEKWGMQIRDALKLVQLMRQDKVSSVGVSFHIPMKYYTHANFKKAINTIGLGFPEKFIDAVNIGGGLDNSHTEEFPSLLDDLKKRLSISNLILEPGRNLLDPCLEMIVSVIGLHEHNDRKWLFIDAGIYSGLLDVVIKNRHFDIVPTTELSVSTKRQKHEYILSGPTADTLDILGTYRFDHKIEVGDKLSIRNAGAYTYVFLTNFSGFKIMDFRKF